MLYACLGDVIVGGGCCTDPRPSPLETLSSSVADWAKGGMPLGGRSRPHCWEHDLPAEDAKARQLCCRCGKVRALRAVTEPPKGHGTFVPKDQWITRDEWTASGPCTGGTPFEGVFDNFFTPRSP